MKRTYIIGLVVLAVLIPLGLLIGFAASGAFGSSGEKLVFSSASAESFYTGEALVQEEWTLESGTLQKGHVANAVWLGSQTSAGSSENAFQMTITDEDGTDVSALYDISYQPGTLTVYPCDIQLRADSGEKTYDGRPLKKGSFQIIGGRLADGHRPEVFVTGERIEAGESQNIITARIYDQEGNDVSGNYNIITNTGTLTVLANPITIKSNDINAVYNGQERYDNEVSIINGALVEGHEIEVVEYAKMTDCGSIRNAFSFIIKDKNGVDVTKNYSVITQFGSFTITKLKMFVQSNSDTQSYNGKPLTNPGWSYMAGSPTAASGHTLEVDIVGTITDVGEVNNIESGFRVLDANGNPCTTNYELEVKPGILKVTACRIEVESFNEEKVYDNTPLTSKNAIHTSGNLAVGHSMILTQAASQTDAGQTTNTVAVAITEDSTGKDVAYNYTIVVKEGLLTVHPREVVIRTGSGNKPYDGTPLTNPEWEFVNPEKTNLLEGHTLIPTVSGSRTEVGESKNIVAEFLVLDDEDNDYSRNYDFSKSEEHYGDLIIKDELKDGKRPLVITANSNVGQYIYNGQPLTDNGYTLTVAGENVGLAPGHTIEVEIIGEQTDVGKSSNMVGLVTILNESGNPVTDQYEITKVDGELEVIPRHITVELGDAEKIYDGTVTIPVEDQSYWYISESGDRGLVDGHEIVSLVVEGSEFEVGKWDTVIKSDSVVIVDENGGTVPSVNYVIDQIKGTFTVTSRTLYVIVGGGSKVYDGTTLASDVSVTVDPTMGDGLLSDHTINYIIPVTDSPNAGDRVLSVNNEYADIRDSLNMDVSEFYEIYISGDPGSYTITKRAVTIQADDCKKPYDGKTDLPLDATASALPATGDDDGLVEGHTFEAVMNGSRAEVGEGTTFICTEDDGSGPVPMVYIYDELSVEVTNNYKITIKSGVLTVRRREITVAGADDTKEYDGTPLTNGNVHIGGDGLIEGHVVTATVTGSITEPGTASNIVEGGVVIRDVAGKNVSGNYTITQYLPGTLTVTKRNIIIATGTAEKPYDGLPLEYKEPHYENANALLAGHNIVITVTGSQTEIGFSSNTYEADSLDIIDENNQSVIRYYNIIEVVEGTLTVTTRPITVATPSNEKSYDGTPLVDHSVEYTADALLPGHKIVITITGSQTEIGESQNTYVTDSFDIVDENEETVKYLYNVTMKIGVLKVVEPEYDFPDGEGDDTLVAKVTTNHSGSIYLRQTSYGDYTGRSWKGAAIYSELLDDLYSMNYLTGLAVGGAGGTLYRIDIELAEQGEGSGTYPAYMLPYYMAIGVDNYTIQSGDTFYSGSDTTYSLSYYTFGSVSLPEEYAAAEQRYRDYVYENYLALPDDTLAYMKAFLEKKNIKISDSANIMDTINQLASCVRNAATYEEAYDRALDSSDDIAVAFLETYREGVCRHYAAAGTALFRALGIPARFTVGYKVDGVEGETVDVTTKDGHAWVEVYLDEIGWVQVEVTGTGAANPNDPIDPDEDITGKLTLKIQPEALEKQWIDENSVIIPDSTTSISSEKKILESLVQSGYTYEVTFVGEQREVGRGTYRIDQFTLKDPTGTELKEGVDYNLTLYPGTMHLYLRELVISTNGASKEYDGTPLTNDTSSQIVEGSLVSNTENIDITVPSFSITECGARANNFTAKIYDADGNDITDRYKITRAIGYLQITQRKIVVQAVTIMDTYVPDVPFICHEIEPVTNLYEGDRIEVEFSEESVLNGPGEICENIITRVRIYTSDNVLVYDSDDKTTVYHYSVTIENGYLITSE